MTLNWRDQARPDQLPPDDKSWSTFVVSAGRGWGKTRAASEWLAEQALIHPGTHWAVISCKWSTTRQICFDGFSGLVRALPEHEIELYEHDELHLHLANGSSIRGFGPQLRALDKQLQGAWVEELCDIEDVETMWKLLMGELWYADKPQVFIGTHPNIDDDDTVTPADDLLRRLGKRDDAIIREGRTWENATNLSKEWLAKLRELYAGTTSLADD